MVFQALCWLWDTNNYYIPRICMEQNGYRCVQQPQLSTKGLNGSQGSDGPLVGREGWRLPGKVRQAEKGLWRRITLCWAEWNRAAGQKGTERAKSLRQNPLDQSCRVTARMANQGVRRLSKVNREVFQTRCSGQIPREFCPVQWESQNHKEVK